LKTAALSQALNHAIWAGAIGFRRAGRAEKTFVFPSS
jgi:hypothetical protein